MWKDITTFSKGDKERKPTIFEAKHGDLRIVILNSHINYRGEWVMHCRALAIDTLPLKIANTKEDAEKLALEIVGLKIANLARSLILLD